MSDEKARRIFLIPRAQAELPWWESSRHYRTSQPRLGPFSFGSSRIPARLFPTKPGEGQNGLGAVNTAYEISANRSKKSVPSEVHESGGGFGPGPEGE